MVLSMVFSTYTCLRRRDEISILAATVQHRERERKIERTFTHISPENQIFYEQGHNTGCGLKGSGTIRGEREASVLLHLKKTLIPQAQSFFSWSKASKEIFIFRSNPSLCQP
jgi:hypothetical protein